MAYAHTTFAQARTSLANYLGDPGKVFWVDTELKHYIWEALRTWGAYSFYWRDKGTFTTTPGVAFYDLKTQLATQLAPTITDVILIHQIQNALMEVESAPTWSGTEMFTMADVTDALNRRLNQFLLEVGPFAARSTASFPISADGRYVVADTTLQVRRVVLADGDNVNSLIHRTDEMSATDYNRDWSTTSGQPYAYSALATPPLTLQVIPPPTDITTIDLVSINSATALDASGIIIPLPDDLTPALKWGALAELLSKDGPANDIQRADYCGSLWDEWIEVAKLYGSVVTSRINDRAMTTTSLSELDLGSPFWQNFTGAPRAIGMVSLNLIAAAPIPDSTYSLTFDVITKAVLPSADGDFIQIGREHLETIIGYAKHLASFKQGILETKNTKFLADNMRKSAILMNAKLAASAEDIFTMNQQGVREPRSENLDYFALPQQQQGGQQQQ